MIKIPKTFRAAGKKYTVKWDNGKIMSRGLVGEADYSSCVVTLSKVDQTILLTRDSVEQVFIHELWHVACNALGEKKLGKDERLADAFSGIFHQMLSSGKGELV
jgi:hypothetical protein